MAAAWCPCNLERPFRNCLELCAIENRIYLFASVNIRKSLPSPSNNGYHGAGCRGEPAATFGARTGNALQMMREGRLCDHRPGGIRSRHSAGGYPQGRSINPNSKPWTTALVRSETPSFEMMCST
jgi:hypothetical protein